MQPPPLPDQEFFSMGEASRIAQVASHTLRYWESHFGTLRPARRSGGHRRYTRADMETIFQIKDLLQRRKMTIAGAKKAFSSRGDGAGAVSGAVTEAATLKVLREVRRELAALVQELSK
ncbi:MAG: MerR family transcriptional regulator [Elusimicrobiota bacterium]